MPSGKTKRPGKITKREIKRLALLIAADELDRSTDLSAEWGLHPETNENLPGEVREALKEEARRMVSGLFAKAFKLG